MACWFAAPHTLVWQQENSLRALEGIRKTIAGRRGTRSLSPSRSKQAANVMLRRRSPSHVSAPPRRSSRAVSRHLIKVGPAKGLARKPIAPAFSARARTLSSGKAVMKMNGAR